MLAHARQTQPEHGRMTTTELQAGRELDALVAEKVMGWVPGAGFESAHYWAFSTDIREAWQVIDRMAADNMSVSVHNRAYGPWACWVGQRLGSSDEQIAFERGETAALAICRAALAALGAV